MSELITQDRSSAAPGALKLPQTYTIDWLASAEAFPAALWSCCFPPPLEGLWWYVALERAGLEDQFKFAYAQISRDGEPVGIAPAFQMDLALEIVLPDQIAPVVAWIGRMVPALRYQRTWFVGSPCSEHATIGLIPGVPLGDVLPELIKAVEARAAQVNAHMIVWKDLTDGASDDLLPYAKAASLFKVPSFPGTEIHNLPASFDGYLASLPSSQRYHFKKKLKASRTALDLKCNVIQSPDAAAMAEIWRLFQFTYDKATTRFERLTPAFFYELAKVPTTYFIMLRKSDGGQLVAFMLCYFENSCATNKFIGIDYSLGNKTFLYFRLFEEFIIWATSRGASSLSSGQTGYRAKTDLGHQLIPLNNFARNRNWLMNKISALVGRSITWSTLDPDLKIYVEARARKGERRG